MNSPKQRLAAISDRARLPRLSRAELERLLVRAKRAFEAFGTSAGPSEAGASDERLQLERERENADSALRFTNPRPAPALTF